MTSSTRKTLGLLATAVLMAGCSTAPQTITVPNPLAAFNGMLQAPRLAAPAYSNAPVYTSVPGAQYQQIAPATYGTINPGYGTTTIPATSYSVPAQPYGTVSNTYSVPSTNYSVAAPTVDTGTYTFNQVPSVNTSVPMTTSSLGTIQPPMPSYSTSSIPTLGTLESAPVPASSPTFSAPMYSTVTSPAMPSYSTSAPTLGTPTLGGTSYDLTAPAINAAPSMGGSFQVLPSDATSAPAGVTLTY